MNEQGQKLVAAFCSRPILLSSRTAHGHRIHCLKMTGIRYQMNVDFCTRASHVFAGCTHVILHIATAQNAAWIHIFKPCKNLLGGTSRNLHHNVQPATVTHAHDQFDRAVLTGCFEDFIHQRNQSAHTLQRKTFGAEIAPL